MEDPDRKQYISPVAMSSKSHWPPPDTTITWLVTRFVLDSEVTKQINATPAQGNMTFDSYCFRFWSDKQITAISVQDNITCDLFHFGFWCDKHINSATSTFFWDITVCGPVKVKQRLGGTYCLQLQGWKTSWARTSMPPPFTLVCCGAYSLSLKREVISFSKTSQYAILHEFKRQLDVVVMQFIFHSSLCPTIDLTENT
jgi:hypothetical protein